MAAIGSQRQREAMDHVEKVRCRADRDVDFECRLAAAREQSRTPTRRTEAALGPAKQPLAATCQPTRSPIPTAEPSARLSHVRVYLPWPRYSGDYGAPRLLALSKLIKRNRCSNKAAKDRESQASGRNMRSGLPYLSNRRRSASRIGSRGRGLSGRAGTPA